MSFQDVEFRWRGENFSIPANKVMRAIAIIEETITLHEMFQYAEKGSAPLSKLAMAFASVLRYAGAKCTDEEVYAAMFAGSEAGAAMTGALQTLLTMMVPTEIADKKSEAPASGNAAAPDKSTSKKRTKPLSGLGG